MATEGYVEARALNSEGIIIFRLSSDSIDKSHVTSNCAKTAAKRRAPPAPYCLRRDAARRFPSPRTNW